MGCVFCSVVWPRGEATGECKKLPWNIAVAVIRSLSLPVLGVEAVVAHQARTVKVQQLVGREEGHNRP